MKECSIYLWLIVMTCNALAQPVLEKTQPDSTHVISLLRASNELQWIDSYQSLAYADEALALAQQLKYKRGIARAQNLRGFCYWAFGDNDLAIASALDALSFTGSIQDTAIRAEACYILGRGYMDLNERVKATQYIVQAEQLARGVDPTLHSSILNLKGVMKFVANDEDSALYYYTKAYDLARSENVPEIQLPRILSNIGECYLPHDREKAFRYFSDALALAKKTQNKIAEASITDIIGHVLLQDKKLNQAESHLESALALSRSLGLRRVIRHAYAGLVDIKLRQGKADEAVRYLQRYYAVRDSLLSSSKIRQIVELEARHALQLKEHQLQVLEKEKRIAALWNTFLLLLVISVVALFIGIYLMQRYRYRKNREVLNLEIDYLTRQREEISGKHHVALGHGPDDALESYDQKLLKKAIGIVEVNLSDPAFGVEKMASEMSMSRTNLHRKIKSVTGFPPSELIRTIRLRKAARMILSKVDSVSQIALLVGFDDYPHFSKAFKKHFGVAPSAFENQHLQAEDRLAEDILGNNTL